MSNNIDPIQSVSTIEDDAISYDIYLDIIKQQDEADAITRQLQTQAQINADEDAEDTSIQQATAQQILDQLNIREQIDQQNGLG